MLDDYRQLLVFVYCCMLMVSHIAASLRRATREASRRTSLKVSRKVYEGQRGKPSGGRRCGSSRGAGTIMIASGFTITCL